MWQEQIKGPTFIGSLVQISILSSEFDSEESEDEENENSKYEIFEGSIRNVSFSAKCITLKNCKSKGKSLPGCQQIYFEQIVKVDILKEGDGSTGSLDCLSNEQTKIDQSTRPMGRNQNSRSDNAHLDKLYPVQMAELVSQLQFEKPAPMEVLVNEPGQPRKIVRPIQHLFHIEGDQFKERYYPELGAIRERVWKNRDTPPDLIQFPSRWYYITDENKETQDIALKDLANREVIGVSLQGQTLCRKGHLSTISLSTPDSVFTFDVVKLGPSIFDAGLRDLLQDKRRLKVFHNCRQASDILFHRYDVKLCNVFDTQAAHSMFLTWAYCGGYMPRYIVSLNHMLRAYFGINSSKLFFAHYRLKHLEEDMSIWMKRPLTPELELGVVSEVIFLLDLHLLTKKAILSPVERITDILLADLRDVEDIPNARKACETSFLMPREAIKALPHQPPFQDVSEVNRSLPNLEYYEELPRDVVHCLPQWRPNVDIASRVGVVDGRFVHQAVGQFDPLMIFSRDVVHQNKVLKY